MLKARKDFYKCPMHKLVRQKSREYLDETGEFSYEKVLEDCHLETVPELIRWDYVFEELEENGYALLPVSRLFFTRQRDKYMIDEAGNKVRQIDIAPGKFLPWGNGKTTAGYVTETNAPLSLRLTYLTHQSARTNGQMESIQVKENRMIQKGLLEPEQPLLLEANFTANN